MIIAFLFHAFPRCVLPTGKAPVLQAASAPIPSAHHKQYFQKKEVFSSFSDLLETDSIDYPMTYEH
jgi:hypothetical protein